MRGSANLPALVPSHPLCLAGHLPRKGGDQPSPRLSPPPTSYCCHRRTGVTPGAANLPPCGGDVRQDRGGCWPANLSLATPRFRSGHCDEKFGKRGARPSLPIVSMWRDVRAPPGVLAPLSRLGFHRQPPQGPGLGALHPAGEPTSHQPGTGASPRARCAPGSRGRSRGGLYGRWRGRGKTEAAIHGGC